MWWTGKHLEITTYDLKMFNIRYLRYFMECLVHGVVGGAIAKCGAHMVSLLVYDHIREVKASQYAG